jgi:hypothetical protein
MLAWKFLNSVIASWAWLKTAFGNERECRAGISSYYQMLSFLNFIKLTKDGEINKENAFGTFPVTTPLCFCTWPREIVERGYELFLNQSEIIKRALGANGLDNAAFEAAWPQWIQQIYVWLGNVYIGRWPGMHVPQSKLPEHLKGNSFKLS